MVTFHGFKVFFCVRILISNCGISSVLSGWKKLNSNVAKLFVYSINIDWPSAMIWNIKHTRNKQTKTKKQLSKFIFPVRGLQEFGSRRQLWFQFLLNNYSMCTTSFKYPNLSTGGVKRPDGFTISRRSNRKA